MCFLFSIVVLTWFVGPHAAETALLGTLLTERDVKACPSTVSSACLDDRLEFHRIRHFFSTDGWLAVLNLFSKLQDIGWLCKVCKRDIHGDSIGCDSCLEWFHFLCAGIQKAPKTKKWFCRMCYSNV